MERNEFFFKEWLIPTHSFGCCMGPCSIPLAAYSVCIPPRSQAPDGSPNTAAAEPAAVAVDAAGGIGFDTENHCHFIKYISVLFIQ